jgi:hypothetical protein
MVGLWTLYLQTLTFGRPNVSDRMAVNFEVTLVTLWYVITLRH